MLAIDRPAQPVDGRGERLLAKLCRVSIALVVAEAERVAQTAGELRDDVAEELTDILLAARRRSASRTDTITV